MKNEKTIWLSDLHFNFTDYSTFQEFVQKLKNEKPRRLLIGGDTGESEDVAFYLKTLEQNLDAEIFFVLGNHDFYGSSIPRVKKELIELTKHSNRLFYLDELPFVELTKNTALIGNSSWADGRLGNYELSDMKLGDFRYIGDFIGLTKEERLKRLNALGDMAASKLKKSLEEAVEKYNQIICLTHVPPFRESCWHKKKISNENSLPYFSCKSVGEVLKKTMQDHPDSYLTVLCGHTHSGGRVKILDNLEVITGKAKYGRPEIQKRIYI